VAEAAAALEVAAVAASAASQLSPFEPPQQKERTGPADHCGRENVEPSTLRRRSVLGPLLCHRPPVGVLNAVLCHPVDPNHDTQARRRSSRRATDMAPLDPNPIILEISTHQRPEELVC
jgi:hypothetical protein